MELIADRAIQNFRNLFSGLPSKTTQQSAGGRPKPVNHGAKRVFNAKTGTYFWKRETWTHRFVCLAQKDQIFAPSQEQKESLRVAGLGEKKIILNKGLCASDVMSEVIKEYPKPAEGGGFELLGSGNRLRDLVLITPPPGGYSVPFLKDSGIGQSVIYIRPIQTDLNLDPVNLDKSDADLVWFTYFTINFCLCYIGVLKSQNCFLWVNQVCPMPEFSAGFVEFQQTPRSQNFVNCNVITINNN